MKFTIADSSLPHQIVFKVSKNGTNIMVTCNCSRWSRTFRAAPDADVALQLYKEHLETIKNEHLGRTDG